jgi:hypothetical protein
VWELVLSITRTAQGREGWKEEEEEEKEEEEIALYYIFCACIL